MWDRPSTELEGLEALQPLVKMTGYFLKQELNSLLKINHISATIMIKSTLFNMKAYKENLLIHLCVILLKLQASIFLILCNKNALLHDYACKWHSCW